MKFLLAFPLLLVAFWAIHRIGLWLHELNLRKSRPTTPEELSKAIAEIYSQARSDLERQRPDNLTMPFLKSIIRSGANAGGDHEILNATVMAFIKKCLIDGDSQTYVSLSMGKGIETAIAESIFSCFEKRELNGATVAEAARMEQKSRSKFERTAWRIVHQLSTTNMCFPTSTPGDI